MVDGEIRVREARPDEFEEVGGVYVRSWRELAGPFGPDLWRRIRANLENIAVRASFSEVLVAERGGTIAGAVSYTSPHVRPAELPGPLRVIPRHWAYVGLLGVLPEHRGSGIGRMLTQACVDRARRDGASSIGLGTRPPMRDAQRLYERLGFRRRPDLELGHEEYLVYERILDEAL